MSAEKRSPILGIVGPTASGKTALGVLCAAALKGTVINVDSVQVYRGCEIGSTKVTAAERVVKGSQLEELGVQIDAPEVAVEHLCLDILEPNEQCDAGAFTRHAEGALQQIDQRGKLPVLVGGTTLYVSALLSGLADLPLRSPELRAELEQLTNTAILERLAAVDPASATRLHANDRVRLIRALEVCLLGGEPLAKQWARQGTGEGVGSSFVGRPTLLIVLQWPREELYRRIDQRTKQLLAAGLLNETRWLAEKFGPDIAPLKALGYAQALLALQGALDSQQLEEQIARETRRYAKRQLTFWRNEPARRGWRVLPEQESEHEELEGESARNLSRRKGKESQVRESFSRSFSGRQQFLSAVSERLEQLRGGEDGIEVWHCAASSIFSK